MAKSFLIASEEYVPDENVFCSINVDKIKGKVIFEIYTGLLSCHLTNTGCLTHQAGLNCVRQLGPLKDNVQFRKFFLPLLLPSFIEKN